jgi:hypothetical protein
MAVKYRTFFQIVIWQRAGAVVAARLPSGSGLER